MIEFDKQIYETIMNSKNVAIIGHVKSDADCLGAESATKSFLLKLNKQVDIFCDSAISSSCLFLPHMETINPEIKDYDLVIVVDCADLERTGKYAELIKKCDKSILFDHHLYSKSDKFTTYQARYDVTSACEVIYHFMKQYNLEIDSDIATALYAGILTDTNSFLNANTTSECHHIVGELFDKIDNFEMVNVNLMRSRTKPRLELLKRALKNMTYILDGKVCISYLTEKDFHEVKTDENEAFGIVDILTYIEGIEIGILISERKHNLYSVSLRGLKRNVSIIGEAFGGGGHKVAAGCNIFGTYKSVINKIEKVIRDNYDRICEY